MIKFSQVQPVLMGAVAGAFGAVLIGFILFGWVTASTADEMANARSKAAVVSALGKICVQQFQHQPEVVVQLDHLKQLTSYRQASFVEEGGWATMPGSEKPVIGVAQACANLLLAAHPS